MADADAALESDPANAAAYALRGEALRLLGMTRLALEAFDRAVDLDPDLKPETFRSHWLAARQLHIPRIVAPQRKESSIAFDLDEWNKLSEAECERHYKQRLRDEEWDKTLAVIVAFVLLVWLAISVFRVSPETTVVKPAPDFADRHIER